MLKYNPKLQSIARRLRQNLTDSEISLWRGLRGKQLAGVQFYRQKPIGEYIVDFYAPKVKLVVEIDGSQHLEARQAEKDRERDDYLGSLGLKVLRFNSGQVLTETEAALQVIHRTVAARLAE